MATCDRVVDRNAANYCDHYTDYDCAQFDICGDSTEGSEVSDSGGDAFVVCFPGEHSHVSGVGGSMDFCLQDAFKRYKKKKQKQIRRARKKTKNGTKEARLRCMSNPDRMWRLRMKFLDEAKRYMGVPYARKYWQPEDPEYKSKLFLDCCGLVRRVMLNLKTEFGFVIGPWNQAYMYDTLPINVKHEDDMKPGDLVFISATYYASKTKRQNHSMTHVEIWLGEGEKTIGARWNRGKVQVFDSYRFKAKSYHSETYIFKSIDTWLKGQCRSHCPEHAWKKRSKKFRPSKKSVFSLDNGQSQSDDKSAGDTDSMMTDGPCSDRMGYASKPAEREQKEEELRVAKARDISLNLDSDDSSDDSSIYSSEESVEDVAEMSRMRISVKKAANQMPELVIEDSGVSSAACSYGSLESTQDDDAVLQRGKQLKVGGKMSGSWETGKGVQNVRLNNGDSISGSINRLTCRSSRENAPRRIERSYELPTVVGPVRINVASLSAMRGQSGPRKAIGNLLQGSMRLRNSWAEKESNAGASTGREFSSKECDYENAVKLSSEANAFSRDGRVSVAESRKKVRFGSSKSDNDLQSADASEVWRWSSF